MFVLKQVLKSVLLGPALWLLALAAVFLFWRRPWARRLLGVTIVGALLLHSGLLGNALAYLLESRYPPLADPRASGPYDAIVVLTGGSIPAAGLIPYPSISESTFRRLEEAWRLYRIEPKPILVSGGHVDPFTPAQGENRIACDYLIRWGVPADRVVSEPDSRDTFESAAAVGRLLPARGWRRYLLVTSAEHMPRSMQVFAALAREPIPAPGDFHVVQRPFSVLRLFPTEAAAQRLTATLNEYIGILNYAWRKRVG
jgi:uncharacterized SAM-binding protein YcdF (DUF218 family)